MLATAKSASGLVPPSHLFQLGLRPHFSTQPNRPAASYSIYPPLPGCLVCSLTQPSPFQLGFIHKCIIINKLFCSSNKQITIYCKWANYNLNNKSNNLRLKLIRKHLHLTHSVVLIYIWTVLKHNKVTYQKCWYWFSLRDQSLW